MKSMNFTHLSRKAAFALVTLLALQCLLINTDASMSTGVATDLNISTEARELERFSDELFNFYEQISNLKKKSRLTSAEIASARSSGNGVKQQIASAQQHFRSLIAKLKAANQWDTLDAKANTLITGGQIRSITQRAGGAKKLFEDLANNLSPLTQEIDRDVQRLSSRVQSRSSSPEGELRTRAVRVAYLPALVAEESFRCRMVGAVTNVRIVFFGLPCCPPPARIVKRLERVCEDDSTSSSPTT
ncbi:MAG: hypothetical protein AB1631_07895 [Acidobacteriota bacterium]